jgi:hypothetical protein
LPPQAAQRSIPEENLLASNDTKESIKRLSNTQSDFRKKVVITKCLCDPCPGLYTDTISESLLIECRDPRHAMPMEVQNKS